MTEEIEFRKATARAWFESLRDRICGAFEDIEDALSEDRAQGATLGRFERCPWQRPTTTPEDDAGGGVM